MKRRLKSVLVTGECVASLARSGTAFLTVESEIPASAKFVTAYYSDCRRSFVCVFEDESFLDVMEGVELEILPGAVTAIDSSVIPKALMKLGGQSLNVIRKELFNLVSESGCDGDAISAIRAFHSLLDQWKSDLERDSSCLSAE